MVVVARPLDGPSAAFECERMALHQPPRDRSRLGGRGGGAFSRGSRRVSGDYCFSCDLQFRLPGGRTVCLASSPAHAVIRRRKHRPARRSIDRGSLHAPGSLGVAACLLRTARGWPEHPEIERWNCVTLGCAARTRCSQVRDDVDGQRQAAWRGMAAQPSRAHSSA